MARKRELQEMIEHCLDHQPETRNSDIALTIAVWERFYSQRLHTSPDGQPAVELRHLYDLPREDNVKRIRAKLNEMGKYWPTREVVAKQRKINEVEWRAYINGIPAAEVQKLYQKPDVQKCTHGLPTFVACPQCTMG